MKQGTESKCCRVRYAFVLSQIQTVRKFNQKFLNPISKIIFQLSSETDNMQYRTLFNSSLNKLNTKKYYLLF